METIDPRGVVKFDSRDMIGTIYVDDHWPLPQIKYQSGGPFALCNLIKIRLLVLAILIFERFPIIVSLWRLSTPRAWPNLITGA